MGQRRKGREIALKVLYSMDYSGNIEDFDYQSEIIAIAANENVSPDSSIVKFAEVLIYDLLQNLELIDQKIQDHSINWQINKIARLDRGLIRLAIAEMICSDIPHPILMNEAIEISKKFCSEDSGKFINGILNSVSKGLSNEKN